LGPKASKGKSRADLQKSGSSVDRGEGIMTIIKQTHMMPIHKLLNRIRWDPEFARGEFRLGYFDRAEDRIILVALKEVTFPNDSPQTFQLTDLEGQIHRIPLHRVREVYKDSQRIWHRSPACG
jgi:uncharacterized protein (UPF0248 family)